MFFYKPYKERSKNALNESSTNNKKDQINNGTNNVRWIFYFCNYLHLKNHSHVTSNTDNSSDLCLKHELNKKKENAKQKVYF